MCGKCYQRRYRPDSSSGFLELSMVLGVFRQCLLKRGLWWELKWKKDDICSTLFGYPLATSMTMCGTNTPHHLPPDALTKVGAKGPPWGKQQPKLWSRKKDPVGRKVLFLFCILPSPCPWLLNGPSTEQCAFEWFYRWWTLWRPLYCQY